MGPALQIGGIVVDLRHVIGRAPLRRRPATGQERWAGLSLSVACSAHRAVGRRSGVSFIFFFPRYFSWVALTWGVTRSGRLEPVRHLKTGIVLDKGPLLESPAALALTTWKPGRDRESPENPSRRLYPLGTVPPAPTYRSIPPVAVTDLIRTPRLGSRPAHWIADRPPSGRRHSAPQSASSAGTFRHARSLL